MSKKPFIYFDNNATTAICPLAKKTLIEWLGCYNASSDSKIALPAKQLLVKAIDATLAQCNVSRATHTVIFTSGGSESNSYIIRACCQAYKKKLYERNSELRPHVILSAVEHNTSIDCVKKLVDSHDADVTFIQPTIYGNILPEDIALAIKPNTCLISIMYANNEIPVINNIKEIGEIAHKHRIPLHSDCVQLFGKYKIDMSSDNIDALSVSAHKFYGPKGIGILVLSNILIEGYGLEALINGTQQGGLRGGTENIPAIASMMAALKYAFTNRKKKNMRLFELRDYLLDKLEKYYNFKELTDYIEENFDGTLKKSDFKDEIILGASEKNKKVIKKDNQIQLISLGPPRNKKSFILPNTVLLAICKPKGKPFCNVELKKYLDSKNIVISIGSACLTNEKHASHVLTAIGAPPIVKRGVIRISFSDNSTFHEIDEFFQVLKQAIDKQKDH